MRYYIYKLTFKSGATYIGQHTEKIESGAYSHPHSEEMKKHLSEKKICCIWIHRGKETKSIKPEMLQAFIKDGWERGRGKLK